MNSHGVRIGTIVVTALLGVTACGSDDTPTTTQPASAPAGATAAPATTAAASDTVYNPTGKGCDTVDPAAIDAVLGTHEVDRENLRVSGTVGTQVQCVLKYDKVLLDVDITTIQGAPGSVLYDGFRGVQEGNGVTLTEVPGVGAAAFSYTDPVTGPHLEAWDGNLYIAVGLNEFAEGSNQDAAAPALPALVTATLTKLRG